MVKLKYPRFASPGAAAGANKSDLRLFSEWELKESIRMAPLHITRLYYRFIVGFIVISEPILIPKQIGSEACFYPINKHQNGEKGHGS